MFKVGDIIRWTRDEPHAEGFSLDAEIVGVGEDYYEIEQIHRFGESRGQRGKKMKVKKEVIDRCSEDLTHLLPKQQEIDTIGDGKRER